MSRCCLLAWPRQKVIRQGAGLDAINTKARRLKGSKKGRGIGFQAGFLVLLRAFVSLSLRVNFWFIRVFREAGPRTKGALHGSCLGPLAFNALWPFPENPDEPLFCARVGEASG